MHPHYFGESESPLFGAYHPPSASVRDHGVLVCAPIAQEYLRTHWALRQLASWLARGGHHVMRFDWFSVGDSAGDTRDGRVERWLADVDAAAAELKDAGGVRRLSAVGLRLGGLLAAASLASPSQNWRARDLVLWDPVVRGADYVSELERMHEKVRTDSMRFGFSVRRDLERLMPSLQRPADEEELIGFAFPSALRSGLGALDLTQLLPAARCDRVTLVFSEDRPEYHQLAAARPGCTVLRSGTPGLWDDFRSVESAFLPGEALQAIGNALGESV